MYVVDGGNDRIVKLSPSGSVLATWGKAGSDPGQFLFLTGTGNGVFEGIAVDGQGDMYVSDTGNRRVEKLGPDGQVLAVWK